MTGLQWYGVLQALWAVAATAGCAFIWNEWRAQRRRNDCLTLQIATAGDDRWQKTNELAVANGTIREMRFQQDHTLAAYDKDRLALHVDEQRAADIIEKLLILMDEAQQELRR